MWKPSPTFENGRKTFLRSKTLWEWTHAFSGFLNRSGKGYGVRVSSYEETSIETKYYNIRNNHVLHDLIDEAIVKGHYHETEYDNGAD